MGYSAFRRARAEDEAQQAAMAEKRREEMERLERFVTRWRAGTRARQAKSRARQLERLDPVEAPSRERSLSFGFPKTERPGRVVLEADGLRVDIADRVLVAAEDLRHALTLSFLCHSPGESNYVAIHGNLVNFLLSILTASHWADVRALQENPFAIAFHELSFRRYQRMLIDLIISSLETAGSRDDCPQDQKFYF